MGHLVQLHSACPVIQAVQASLAEPRAGHCLLELPLLTPRQPQKTQKGDLRRRAALELGPSQAQQMMTLSLRHQHSLMVHLQVSCTAAPPFLLCLTVKHLFLPADLSYEVLLADA